LRVSREEQLTRRHLHRLALLLLGLVAAAEFVAAIVALSLGGFRFDVGPLRISAGGPFRPFVIAVVCSAVVVLLKDSRADVRAEETNRRWITRFAYAVPVVTFLVALRFSAFAVGAADSYGYVSQALLWLEGDLVVKEPLGHIDPIIAAASSPLGYRFVPPDSSAPTYPPGVPMLMALAAWIGGTPAIYLVVPLSGAVAVWLTYRLGLFVGRCEAALIASVLLACSPIFLLQLFVPMSDLVATACWLAALVSSLSQFRGSVFVAGLCGSMAILARPNLLPVSAAVAAALVVTAPRARRLLWFTLALVPGCMVIAFLNDRIYGSWVLSGYGSPETLFSWRWIATNMMRYPRWLVELHGPVILLSLLAPFVLAARDTGHGPERHASLLWILLAYCSTVFACYIAYVPYNGWQFLRFWLPAIPVLLVLSASVAVQATIRLPAPARSAFLLAFCGLAIAAYLSMAQRLGDFYVGREERRYLTVGNYLRNVLPDKAVVVAGLHSGSLRLYGGHHTIRWDQLKPSDLDHVLGALRRHGFEVYALLEGEEESQFRNWFGAATPLGKLESPPLYEYFGHQHARVYSLSSDVESHVSPIDLPKPIPEDP
jgi:hypothetical protein